MKSRQLILELETGEQFVGQGFGGEVAVAGEVVFSTGMVGYPESLTDPSFRGQILVYTYPLIGNYGVPDQQFWESDRIQVAGLVVAHYVDTPSHATSRQSLARWLATEGVPGIEIGDTRRLTLWLRERGTVLGKISGDRLVEFHDASQDNLVAQVSRKQVAVMGDGSKRVVVIDCGVKRSIQATLVRKDCTVMTVPWDYDVEELLAESTFDGVVISNGPGNPQMVPQTIETVSKLMAMQVPILGICLGNQILSLAAGGDTNKLKFGHRSQNQPCLMRDSQRCYLTTQNHGFAVSEVPEGFEPWFVNANDGSNEGIIHSREPWMAVQFHPEAMPGPTDTEWVFDYWLERI